MRLNALLVLFDYNYWARDRVLMVVGQLSSDQMLAPAVLSYGSILGALTHVLNAECLWRTRCQEKTSPLSVPYETAVASLERLEHLWQEEEAAMRDYLNTLEARQLDELVAYRGLKGQAYENYLWQILTHVVTHGISHRAEMAAHLTRLGKAVGNTDFVIYARGGDLPDDGTKRRTL